MTHPCHCTPCCPGPAAPPAARISELERRAEHLRDFIRVLIEERDHGPCHTPCVEAMLASLREENERLKQENEKLAASETEITRLRHLYNTYAERDRMRHYQDNAAEPPCEHLWDATEWRVLETNWNPAGPWHRELRCHKCGEVRP